MVSFANLFKGVKWFLIIVVIDILAYPLILPIINQMEGNEKYIYQGIVFLILTIITIGVPTLVALSNEEDNE